MDQNPKKRRKVKHVQKPLLPPINYKQVVTAADARLNEIFDGYIVLGFVAGTGQSIKMIRSQDPKTAIALRALLNEFLMEHST